MTRRQRNEREHERREQERKRAGEWGTAGEHGMRCAHCGHAHVMQGDRCPNCDCRDFDF